MSTYNLEVSDAVVIGTHKAYILKSSKTDWLVYSPLRGVLVRITKRLANILKTNYLSSNTNDHELYSRSRVLPSWSKVRTRYRTVG